MQVCLWPGSCVFCLLCDDPVGKKRKEDMTAVRSCIKRSVGCAQASMYHMILLPHCLHTPACRRLFTIAQKYKKS